MVRQINYSCGYLAMSSLKTIGKTSAINVDGHIAALYICNFRGSLDIDFSSCLLNRAPLGLLDFPALMGMEGRRSV